MANSFIGHVAIQKASQAPGTFTTATRFHVPSTMRTVNATVPTGYATIDTNIGRIAQAKSPPKITENTQKFYELPDNRTFFGFPAKCEGPGAAQYSDDTQLAFHTISAAEKELNSKAADRLKELAKSNSRFDISRTVAHKEYKTDLQSATTGKYPSASKYDQAPPFRSPKEYRFPVDHRHSNDLPVKNDTVNPQTYDVLSG